jgi:hypothetical protein
MAVGTINNSSNETNNSTRTCDTEGPDLHVAASVAVATGLCSGPSSVVRSHIRVNADLLLPKPLLLSSPTGPAHAAPPEVTPMPLASSVGATSSTLPIGAAGGGA